MSERSEAVEQIAVCDAAPAYRVVPAEAMSDDMPPGYKRTEVGVIPQDWDLKALKDVAEIRTGIAKNSKAIIVDPVNVHYLRVANVQDGFLDLTEMKRIKVSKADLKRYSVLPGDVLMNEGGDLDKLGRGAVWTGSFDPCVHQNHVFVVRCKGGLESRFLSSWTSTDVSRSYFLVAGKQTTNLASINKTALGELPVVIPSLPEQRAIAVALSDVDALIGSLDRLIAKKRATKQATMQQLLTGQTRLPGFTEEWETKRLGDLGPWRGGLTPSMANNSYWDGGTIPWLSSSDVRQGVINSLSGRVTEKALRETALTLFPKDSVVVATRSGILRRYLPVAVTSTPLVINQDLRALPPGPDHNPEFLAQALLAFDNRIRMKCVKAGTTVESIDSAWFRGLDIGLPSLDEQRAIANVLFDMDAEIEAVERRRDKARQIKQGMMQQLLTGRVRLVQPEVAI